MPCTALKFTVSPDEVLGFVLATFGSSPRGWSALYGEGGVHFPKNLIKFSSP